MKASRKFLPLTITAALALIAATASAAQTTTTTVRLVRVYTHADDSTRVDIKFSDDVTTGCTYNEWISFTSGDVTTEERRKSIRDIATAALLSKRQVTVYTASGCINSKGKINYIGLEED